MVMPEDRAALAVPLKDRQCAAFAECPEHAPVRERLSTQFAIPAGWWLQQPRVLSKSGWITQDAGISHAQRVQRQIAACALGIAIAKMGDLVAEDG